MVAGLMLAVSLAGVWVGKIGTHQITVCFNDDTNGSYYYHRTLSPLQLSGQSLQSLAERDGGGNVTGAWRLDKPQGAALSGTWHKPTGAKLPIALTRLTAGDADQGCSSNAFNNRIERDPEIVINDLVFEHHPYKEITVLSPKGTNIGPFTTIQLDEQTPAAKSVNDYTGGLIPPCVRLLVG